jgi:transposase InsO family protein
MKQFLQLIKNQHDKVIKQCRSDRGGEFKNKKLDELLAKKGIVRQTSALHIHQQNGRAECLNDTILEKSKSM